MSSPLLRTLFFIAIAIGLGGCAITQGKASAATRTVDTIHQQYNESKFRAIYAAATPGFRTTANEAGFLRFMQAVRTKLGAFQGGTLGSSSTKTTPSGTTVALTYKSQFERGPAVETFNFLMTGEAATLQGYNVNSPALLLN